MIAMFRNAIGFNQPLDEWKVDGVEKRNMFQGATQFNHPLPDWCNGTVHGTT